MQRRSSRLKKEAKGKTTNEVAQNKSQKPVKERTTKKKNSAAELLPSVKHESSADTNKDTNFQEISDKSTKKRKLQNKPLTNDNHELNNVKKEEPEIIDDDDVPANKRKATIPKRNRSIKKIKESPKTNVKEEIKTKNTKRQRSIRPLKNLQITDEISDIAKSEVKEENNFGVSVKKEIDDTTEMKCVGAHMSIAGGLENAVFDAVKIGAKSFGMFLKSQRQWASKPLEDTAALKFRDACNKTGFSSHLILPHGSYLLNCGSPNEETLSKSRAALTDELQRCEKLGLTLFNFHPGSTCGEITVDECLDRIAQSINEAHSKTKYVITVIENMSCQGNTVGGKFEELKGIIDRVHDKSRMGVCLDTCHAFAAGYDLSTQKGFNKMMEDFEKQVGFEYLKALHLNDSKGKVGCNLDRHENIGKGFIGLEGFQRIMNDPHFNNIPLILETPFVTDDINAKEIKLLYSLVS